MMAKNIQAVLTASIIYLVLCFSIDFKSAEEFLQYLIEN